MKQLIPKKIHYCWYGEDKLPEIANRCIESWRQYLPDYSFKRWDESNTNLTANRYIREAYKSGKYAFVSDYVRLKALYEEGGIYLDIDVELLSSLDPYLVHEAFLGFESTSLLSSSLIGTIIQHPWIGALTEKYESMSFLTAKGLPDLTPNTILLTNYSKRQGLVLNGKFQKFGRVTVYPKEVFSPKNYDDYYVEITDKTSAVHHFSGTWYTPLTRWLMWVRVRIIKRFIPFMDRPVTSIYHLLKRLF